MLERATHGDACFVTLTYADDKVPADGSVEPKVAQLWLKRLRARMAPRSLRFFLVGEYGEETRRPHYHAALFGMPSCMRGRTDHRLERCCASCQVIKESWGLGGIDCRELSMETAQYLVGYVAKKLSPRLWEERFGQLTPEFARMSLRPGIGAPAIPDVLSSLDGRLDTEESASLCLPVPTVLMHGRRTLPLGRYLREKLRASGKFSDQETDRKVRAEALLAVSKAHGTAKAVEALKLAPEVGLIQRVERKAKMFATKGSL